jgi:glucose-1-phosphate cytidylyltransferase
MPSVKVVILAGGQGTRLAEETDVRPKPMVEIGGRPILWHIMKHYAQYGFSEFVVALGYRGEDIKKFFLDYLSLSGDLTVSVAERKVERLNGETENWTVHLVDTGLGTNTGGRVGRLASWLSDGPFMLTYGDGVADIDLTRLLAFHRTCSRMVTVSAVRPPSRFGGLSFNSEGVAQFTEKPQIGEGWINGGFMVVEPEVLSYIHGDATSFESDVLERLSQEGGLAAYPHEGFWQCLDTLRDVRHLRTMWETGEAPWVTWA